MQLRSRLSSARTLSHALLSHVKKTVSFLLALTASSVVLGALAFAFVAALSISLR